MEQLGVMGSRCGATPIDIWVTVVVDILDGKHWVGLMSFLVYIQQPRSLLDEGLDGMQGLEMAQVRLMLVGEW